MDFTPIETAEAFETAVKSRLEEEAKKFEGYISPEEVGKLNEKIKAHETEISTLTAKNKAYESHSVKLKVAHESGIPFELADKLSGDTEDEIRKDAEKFVSLITQSKKPAPAFSSETPPEDEKKAALLSMLRKLNNNE
jgi:hypothetical protein